MKVTLVAGARPNFIKIAPLIDELKKQNIQFSLVNTGQHYDDNMSKIFFENLNLPTPDATIESKSPKVIERTSLIIKGFEDYLLQEKPDLVIVVGDVDSTFACAYTARRLKFKVAHVEAGLRSRNEKMPEETNRILTDHVSDLLFVTEPDAVKNLVAEGIPEHKIHLVGNVMIDSLLANLEKIKSSTIIQKTTVRPKEYCVVTLHRPENVDDKENLAKILTILNEIQQKTRVIIPLHPRTKARLQEFDLFNTFSAMHNVLATEPLGYLDFLNLVMNAKFTLSDSGGLSEEATALKVPCLTMRQETERPITVRQGTNTLVNTNKELILETITQVEKCLYKQGEPILYWDGRAAERIVQVIKKLK